MANELPEVTPVITNMPTEGWFCKTSGSARRRITANQGSSAQPVFKVTGVPGHSHNASAVIEVDADYTRYRDGPAAIGAELEVFGDQLILFPAGQLLDSVLPHNAAVRFDRCIERCVKSIELRPENCTGNITEPTRAMSEVRTLTASKARLATLTYVEETQGWKIPQGADDEQNPQREYAPLVSNFPDIFVDMLPLNGLLGHPTSNANPGGQPSPFPPYPMYIEDLAPGVAAVNRRYVTIRATNDDWDGTIRFRWDSSTRGYYSEETTVIITHAVSQEAGGGNATIYDGGLNEAKLAITFPSMATTPAQTTCLVGKIGLSLQLHRRRHGWPRRRSGKHRWIS